jgi:iron complex outermembrane receptor protein
VFLEDIKRIEVISGPGGSVWGANAVNGVISVISMSAQETQGLFVEAGIGTQPRAEMAVRYGDALGEAVHYRVWGKYVDAEDEEIATGQAAGDAWHRTSGGFRIDGSEAPEVHWTFQGDIYSGRDGQVAGSQASLSGGNVLGRWRRHSPTGSELLVRGYFDWARLALPVPELIINGLPFAPAGTFRDRLETYDLEALQRVGPRGNHQVTWGLGFRLWRDRVENAPALGFLPEAQDHRLWSGFVQDELTVGARMRLTFGTKVEHNDYTGFEIEPTVRLLFAQNDRRIWWAAVSRAVRTPSRIDREFSQPVPPHLVLLRGSPEFRTEEVVAVELGHRSVLEDRVSVAVASFYNEYRDIRSTSTTATTILPFFFANNVEGDTYGFEATATVAVHERLRLHVGYTLLQTHLRVREGQQDFNAALNETADPQQQAQVRVSVDITQKLGVDAALRWVDALHINSGPVLGTVPSYFDLDIRLAWRVSASLELALVGRNLLHDAHPEYGFPGPQRVEIGRAVVGRLAWRR